jgi:hypothetical protein
LSHALLLRRHRRPVATAQHVTPHSPPTRPHPGTSAAAP